jgi:DNA polymerase-3 subunit delta
VKLTPAELGGALRRRIAPLYLVFGDEPLQVTEAVAAIRSAARNNGFPDWELFFVQPGFDWASLRDAAATLPLFGGSRVLDVRVPEKPDQDGVEFLAEYVAAPSPDCVLVLSAGKLSSEDQKKIWFQGFERAGVVVQAKPLTGRPLLQWLDHRLSAKGLLLDQPGLAALAARVEGNLLAAAQEIEKLHILYGSGMVDERQIAAAVADAARFDVYDLVDAALDGNAARVKRILDGLCAEGAAPALVLWALAGHARALATVVYLMGGGTSFDAACGRLPTKLFGARKSRMSQAATRIDLQRAQAMVVMCAAADRKIKGEGAGDPWEALLAISVAFCGFSGLPV